MKAEIFGGTGAPPFLGLEPGGAQIGEAPWHCMVGGGLKPEGGQTGQEEPPRVEGGGRGACRRKAGCRTRRGRHPHSRAPLGPLSPGRPLPPGCRRCLGNQQVAWSGRLPQRPRLHLLFCETKSLPAWPEDIGDGEGVGSLAPGPPGPQVKAGEGSRTSGPSWGTRTRLSEHRRKPAGPQHQDPLSLWVLDLHLGLPQDATGPPASAPTCGQGRARRRPQQKGPQSPEGGKGQTRFCSEGRPGWAWGTGDPFPWAPAPPIPTLSLGFPAHLHAQARQNPYPCTFFFFFF